MSNSRGRFRGSRWHRGRGRSSTRQPAARRDDPPDREDSSDDEYPIDPGPSMDVSGMNNCPYSGWKLYFDDEEYSKQSPLVRKIEAMEEFLDRHADLVKIDSLTTGSAFSIDVNVFYKDDLFMNDWSNFKNDLHNNPQESLNCIGLALHQIVAEALKSVETENSFYRLTNRSLVRVKVFNYHPSVSLKDLKVNSYGKLISTRGCVIRVGRTRQLSQWIVFACAKCSLQRLEKQPNGIYTVPRKCDVCGPSKFLPKLDSFYVKTAPFQTIRIQELFGEDQDDRGRMPRILEVELLDDLVDSCMPGDDVTVVGIIKVRGTDDGIGVARGNTVNACSLYMDAVSITNNKSKTQNKTEVGIELNVKDYFAISAVHKEPDIFSLLVRSLCPNIYGHDIVKAGLLLSLFGGSAKHAHLRDDIHVIMIGDPGLGKSQMLQACTRVATKGVYVCGNSSTCSGLTVTLTKETGTSDFALEPGALVLADRGCCLIDEFDKMPTQHQALLEAMEQQSVSVAKSGVVCSLPARTSILAAANPIGGRYDRSKTVVENLNLSVPLLSRFDLVFLLLDQPNEMLDSMMCAHVMNTHRKGKKIVNESSSSSQPGTSSEHNPTRTVTLRERLSVFTTRKEDLIPQSIMRKYIAYARQYVQPRLSLPAAAVLKEFYLDLRQRNNIFGSIPVYNRQLEALIRLTEARAKLELRDEATESDANEVVELFQCTLEEVPPLLPAPAGTMANSGKITGNKVQIFIRLLRDEVDGDNEKRFTKKDLINIAEGGGVNVQDFNRLITRLNEEGILLKRGGDSYQFVDD